MDNIIKLKVCPFCGKEGIMTKSDGISAFDKVFGCIHFTVTCINPECIGFDITPRYRTTNDAVEAWNKRILGE